RESARTMYIFPPLFFLLVIRRPPRPTLFPTRRSSDLKKVALARAASTGEPKERTATVSAVELPAVNVTLPNLKVQRPTRLVALRSEEHTSELQSLAYLVCRLPLEKKKNCQSHTTRVTR